MWYCRVSVTRLRLEVLVLDIVTVMLHAASLEKSRVAWFVVTGKCFRINHKSVNIPIFPTTVYSNSTFIIPLERVDITREICRDNTKHELRFSSKPYQ